MMRCKQLFTALSLVVPAAVVLVASPLASSEASAEERYPNLCENTRGVCDVGPMAEAVKFEANVCWDGETVTVMGSGGCDRVSRGFYLSYGYVIDPIANTVFAYSPVMDACDAGFCVTDQIDPGALLDAGVICCSDNGVCTMSVDMQCTKDKPMYCLKIEENDDGTVTCHE